MSLQPLTKDEYDNEKSQSRLSAAISKARGDIRTEADMKANIDFLNRKAAQIKDISDERLAAALEKVIGKGIEAIWLRRTGGEGGHGVEVLVQIDGDWFVAIQEDIRANFSHTAHVSGLQRWPLADFGDG